MSTRFAHTAASMDQSLTLAGSTMHAAVQTGAPRQSLGGECASFSAGRKVEVAKALGMRGMEALLYVATPKDHPRPMIQALLQKLPIQGMDT